MDLPNLGHAVIVSNVTEEMPGSEVDIEALRLTYQKVGFDVRVHNDCSEQVNIHNWNVTFEAHPESIYSYWLTSRYIHLPPLTYTVSK